MYNNLDPFWLFFSSGYPKLLFLGLTKIKKLTITAFVLLEYFNLKMLGLYLFTLIIIKTLA